MVHHILYTPILAWEHLNKGGDGMKNYGIAKTLLAYATMIVLFGGCLKITEQIKIKENATFHNPMRLWYIRNFINIACWICIFLLFVYLCRQIQKLPIYIAIILFLIPSVFILVTSSIIISNNYYILVPFIYSASFIPFGALLFVLFLLWSKEKIGKARR